MDILGKERVINMNSVKYFGIILIGMFFWTVAGFVHEDQLIKTCEKGQSVQLRHPSYNLQGCKLVRK